MWYFQFEEVPFSRKEESVRKIYQEVLLLIKFQQTKPQVKSMNIYYYDLYYTVINNREDNETVNNKNKKNITNLMIK